jgi:hypothetical protein
MTAKEMAEKFAIENESGKVYCFYDNEFKAIWEQLCKEQQELDMQEFNKWLLNPEEALDNLQLTKQPEV